MMTSVVKFWIKYWLCFVVCLLFIIFGGCVTRRIIEKQQSDMAKKLNHAMTVKRREINLVTATSAPVVTAIPVVKQYFYVIYDPITMCTPQEQSKWLFKVRASGDLRVPVKQWPVIVTSTCNVTEFEIAATNKQMFFHSTICNTNGLWEFETGSRKPF